MSRSFFALFFTLTFLFGGCAHQPQQPGVQVTFHWQLPDRWLRTALPTDGTFLAFTLKDQQNEADCYLISTFPETPPTNTFSSLRAWVEKRQMASFFASYENPDRLPARQYFSVEREEGAVKLGNGAEATFIRDELSNNNPGPGHVTRSAIFFFWESRPSGRLTWNYGQCAGNHMYKQLRPNTAPMAVILMAMFKNARP